jgi:hypothetical protein
VIAALSLWACMPVWRMAAIVVAPWMFAHFCEIFTREMNRQRMESRANIAAGGKRIDREMQTLLDHPLWIIATLFGNQDDRGSLFYSEWRKFGAPLRIKLRTLMRL